MDVFIIGNFDVIRILQQIKTLVALAGGMIILAVIVLM